MKRDRHSLNPKRKKGGERERKRDRERDIESERPKVIGAMYISK